MVKAGLNGNFHREHISNTEGGLRKLGIEYHGEGHWTLPKNGTMIHVGENDWMLQLEQPKGTREYYVWTEEENGATDKTPSTREGTVRGSNQRLMVSD